MQRNHPYIITIISYTVVSWKFFIWIFSKFFHFKLMNSFDQSKLILTFLLDVSQIKFCLLNLIGIIHFFNLNIAMFIRIEIVDIVTEKNELPSQINIYSLSCKRKWHKKRLLHAWSLAFTLLAKLISFKLNFHVVGFRFVPFTNLLSKINYLFQIWNKCPQLLIEVITDIPPMQYIFVNT
jgi:hypothetical protein